LRVPADFSRSKAVNLGGVQAEDLGAQGRGDFRIAEALAQARRDLESAEGLDLVLGRAVPDGVGAPEDVVGPAVADQLSEGVRGMFGLAHQEAPGAAELGVDVAPRLHLVL
jgi:hypothetical protein